MFTVNQYLSPVGLAAFEGLSEEQKLIAEKEFLSKRKSASSGYLLWFFLGWHHAYLTNWILQILYWLTFGGLLVWMFLDLLLIPTYVKRKNEAIATDILKDIKVLSL